MIKEINDIEKINGFLKHFDTKINEIGIFSHYADCSIDEKTVGFIGYDLIYDRIEITYIYVEENHRRKGIASNFIEYLINIGEKNNCKNITLEVKVSNNNAISFYKNNGFVIVSKRENYYNNEDGLLMIRELD